MMIEIRFHGRGGQGSITGAVMLADAVFREERYCQKIPVYTTERRGAPVEAYIRIDDKPITITSAIYEPDIIIVLDERLSGNPIVSKGLKEGGMAVLNSGHPPTEVDLGVRLSKIGTVSATDISTDLFGRRAIPITNTIMLGAFSRVTGLVGLNSIKEVIKETFPGKIGKINIRAADRGYKDAKIREM